MTTYYKKVGRRYHPVSETDAYDGLREGCWLVIVQPGQTSIRLLINPENAAVEAAMKTAEDAMVTALRKASELQIPKRITGKERKALKAYLDVMGEGATATFTSDSLYGVVEAGINALREEIERKEKTKKDAEGSAWLIARDIIKGNWQDPDIMRMTREMTETVIPHIRSILENR